MARAIVLGAYGMIGAACVRALSEAGYDITGIGRNTSAAQAAQLPVRWIFRDLPSVTVDEWREILRGADVVVNAAGALQDGPRDSLEAIHVTCIAALTTAAAELDLRVVQISAAGVSEAAATEFFRSKARGDALIEHELDNWVILRPTLVLAREAYGGTALLRAVATLPLVEPRVLPDVMVQTVSLDDVAEAVVRAAGSEIPAGTIADLTETGCQSFADLISVIRRWQGTAPPAMTVKLPDWSVHLSSVVADGLGCLGWRSPLRSSAIRALDDGIRGDPLRWQAAGGRPCMSLHDTLGRMPATRQDRLFARAYLALPLAIAMLSLFWILSGMIPFFDLEGTISILVERGAPTWVSMVAVIGGSLLDVALGLGILWRNWTKAAAMGMIILSCGYILGSVLMAPDLWLDPLGPMVKVLPGIALAAFVWLLMEDR